MLETVTEDRGDVKACSVDQCVKPGKHKARSGHEGRWCDGHLKKFLRYGDVHWTRPTLKGSTCIVESCDATAWARGVLCRFCNVSIGQVGEDPEVLRRLADYLEEQHRIDAELIASGEVLPLKKTPNQRRAERERASGLHGWKRPKRTPPAA